MWVKRIDATTDTPLEGETARWEVRTSPGTEPDGSQVAGFVRVLQRGDDYPGITTIALFSDNDLKGHGRFAVHLNPNQLAELIHDLEVALNHAAQDAKSAWIAHSNSPEGMWGGVVASRTKGVADGS